MNNIPFTPNLFWDIDAQDFGMERCPAQIVQRVLEYGQMNDWDIIRKYYGIPRVAEICKGLRTLDPRALAFITCISHTNKEDYRCYHIAQSTMPTHR